LSRLILAAARADIFLEDLDDDFSMGRVGQPFPEDIASVAFIALDFNDETGRNLVTNVLPLLCLLSLFPF
jgi:hypothetical protein